MKKIIKVRYFFDKQYDTQYSSLCKLDGEIPTELKDGGL